jgi:hypothetical protein
MRLSPDSWSNWSTTRMYARITSLTAVTATVGSSSVNVMSMSCVLGPCPIASPPWNRAISSSPVPRPSCFHASLPIAMSMTRRLLAIATWEKMYESNMGSMPLSSLS